MKPDRIPPVVRWREVFLGIALTALVALVLSLYRIPYLYSGPLGVVITLFIQMLLATSRLYGYIAQQSAWSTTIAVARGSGLPTLEALLSTLLDVYDATRQFDGPTFRRLSERALGDANTELAGPGQGTYATQGQQAYEDYITFLRELQRGDEYLGISFVATSAFWGGTPVQQLAFEANRQAAQAAKVRRIFLVPDEDSLRRDAALRAEIRRHVAAGVEVRIALLVDLPAAYRQDLGIFKKTREAFVGRLRVDASGVFTGIDYSFEPGVVRDAESVWHRVADRDIATLAKRSVTELLDEYDGPVT